VLKSTIEARLAFTLIVLEEVFGPNGSDSEKEEPEVHIDCSCLLSSLVAANDVESSKEA
jgi:hypothetical protein